MDSTSPYTARKTPPTASMKSMAAGDENTPPGHEMARVMSEKGTHGELSGAGLHARLIAQQFSQYHTTRM